MAFLIRQGTFTEALDMRESNCMYLFATYSAGIIFACHFNQEGDVLALATQITSPVRADYSQLCQSPNYSNLSSLSSI